MVKPATPRQTRNSRGLRQSSVDRSSRESSIEPKGVATGADNTNTTTITSTSTPSINPTIPVTPFRRSARLSSRSPSVEPQTPANAAVGPGGYTPHPARVTKPRQNKRPTGLSNLARNLQCAKATTLSPIVELSPRLEQRFTAAPDATQQPPDSIPSISLNLHEQDEALQALIAVVDDEANTVQTIEGNSTTEVAHPVERSHPTEATDAPQNDSGHAIEHSDRAAYKHPYEALTEAELDASLDLSANEIESLKAAREFPTEKELAETNAAVDRALGIFVQTERKYLAGILEPEEDEQEEEQKLERNEGQEPKRTVSDTCNFDEDEPSELYGPLFADFLLQPNPITVDKDVAHETQKFRALQKEEGYKLGRKLYESIQADHESRGCECGLPVIHATREEAEAGEGTLRFYYKDVSGWTDKKIWVFMRKNDKLWHCQCNAQHLSDFALWVRKNKAEGSRKRKAEEDELELERYRAYAIARPVETGSNRSRSVESMYRTFANAIKTMGNSVKGFLRNLRDGATRARQTYEALETRRMDETGTHLVVKRLKRQYTRPLEAAQTQEEDTPSDFDRLAYFEWTDDPSSYIGGARLTSLHLGFQRYVEALEVDHFIIGNSVEEITKLHKQGLGGSNGTHRSKDPVSVPGPRKPGANTPGGGNNSDVDLEMSLAIHHLLRQDFDDVMLPNQKKAKNRFEEGVRAVCRFMDLFYTTDSSAFAEMKAQYPKPPKYLPDLPSYFKYSSQRTVARTARNFLAFILTLKELFQIGDEYHTAVAKIIVDCDAVHKREIPPSWVVFPGRKDEAIMPGTFPEDVVEEVPADNLIIEPVYDIRHPDPEPEVDPPTPYKPRPTKVSKPPKGIMREPQQFDRHPRVPMPGDRPGLPRLRFADRVAAFKPIGDLRERYRVRKAPSATTQKLWADWWNLLLGGAVRMPRGHAKRIPTGRPEDQTMEESGGWRMKQDPATGKCSSKRDPATGKCSSKRDPATGKCSSKRGETKYDRFLEETRYQLLEGGGSTSETTPLPSPKKDGTTGPEFTPSRLQQSRTTIGDSASTKQGSGKPTARHWRHQSRRVAQPEKRVKTAAEKAREIELLFHDLEINKEGEVVHRQTLVPEADLLIATRKLDDMELCRQIRVEVYEAAERKRIEIARKIAEEKKRREEEEKRKRDEERRREEERRRKSEEETRRRRAEAEGREKQLTAAREATQRLAQLGLRRPSKTIISTLPDQWQSRVNAARQADPNANLAKIGDGTNLQRRDFAEKLLPEQAWLNDNIINGSFSHVADWVNQRAGKTETPPCVAMSTYFWPYLCDKGAPNTVRMSKRAGVRQDNFGKLKTILIPICKGLHWTLAVVFPQLQAVTHMDSFQRGHGEPLVHKAVLEWVKVIMGKGFAESEWVAVNIDAPQQTNGYDCGVFAITNSLCIALGLDPKLSYSEMQLPAQRRQLAAVLLNGGFKGDFDLAGL